MPTLLRHTEPTSETARSGRASRTTIALIAAIAVVLSAARFSEHVILRGTDPFLALVPLLALTAGALLARVRKAPATAAAIGVFACAACVGLCGLPELPPWPSVDAFGKSPLFTWLTFLILAASFGFARPREGSQEDAALVLFVVLSAFGGPLLLRSADEFHALLLLFGLASIAASRFGSIRARTPFLPAFALFLAASFATLPFSVDKGRHLVGCLRAATAAIPLLLLAAGPPDLERALRLVRVHAWTVLAGFTAAIVVILEAGYHFRLDKAFAAEMSLFGEHPNIVAPYFAVAPPLILALLPACRSRFGRALVVAAAVAAFAGLWFTESLAAFGGQVVGVVVFGVLLVAARVFRRLGRRATWSLAAALLALTALAAFAFGDRVGPAVDRAFGSGSMAYRAYLWDTAARAIGERPLEGYGYLTSDPLKAFAGPSDYDGSPKDTHPHNLLLAIAMGGGAAAALAFLALATLFLWRMAKAACSLADRRARLLAAGTLGSGAALLSSNLFDQGLSLHTPFPLHLGLLVGIASVLWRLAAESLPAPSVPPSRARRGLAVGLLVAFMIPASLLPLADRFAGRAEICRRNGDEAGSVALAAWARRLDPWSLEHGLRLVRALDAAGRTQAAVEVARDLADEHPLSARPLDELSRLQVERREYAVAIDAVKKAIALDPTGPEVSKWKRRLAEIHMATGDQTNAEIAYAESIRYDFEAVHRIPWRYAETDPREFYIRGPKRPIFLYELLTQNRRVLPEIVKRDPVRGRRAATTLVKAYMRFHWLKQARKVIDEYEQYAGEPWLPLKVLAIEIDKTLARGEPDRGAHLLDPSAAEPSEFEGEEGEAGIFLAEGERLLAAGLAEQALSQFERAIDRLYDMVAEKHYVARVVDGIFDAHRARGDLDGARHALRATLYFHSTPDQRAQRIARMAKALCENGEGEEAAAMLESTTRHLRRLSSSRGEFVIADVSAALACLMKTEDPLLSSRAQAILQSLGDTPAGALLDAFTQRDLGNAEEFERRMIAARARFPEWMRDIQIRRN